MGHRHLSEGETEAGWPGGFSPPDSRSTSPLKGLGVLPFAQPASVSRAPPGPLESLAQNGQPPVHAERQAGVRARLHGAQLALDLGPLS